jgi:hypothetical protein
VPGRGKRSRSVWEDDGTKDVRCQVSLWHSAYLQVIDLCRRERRRSKDAAPRSAPEHLALASSSASGGSCSGLDLCAGSYIHTAKIIWGIPVVTSILRTLVGALSPSASALTPDPDSSDDYPDIGASTYGEPGEGGHLICMVASSGDRSNNTSSRYPTIGRSEASDT